MNNLPSWDTIKAELRAKWWIVVVCALAGAYQGLVFLVPSLPNPFRF